MYKISDLHMGRTLAGFGLVLTACCATIAACDGDDTAGAPAAPSGSSSSGSTSSSSGTGGASSSSSSSSGAGGASSSSSGASSSSSSSSGAGGASSSSSGAGGAGPDAYPAEHGFEFDGAWYPVTDIQPCGSNGTNLSTYSVGTRTGTSDLAIVAWLFASAPAPGSYTVSPYDGAVGPKEADMVLTDLRDNSQWLTDAKSGSVTVYDAGAKAIDVVWHNVSIHSIVPVGTGVSTEGWVTCTLP